MAGTGLPGKATASILGNYDKKFHSHSESETAIPKRITKGYFSNSFYTVSEGQVLPDNTRKCKRQYLQGQVGSGV